MSQRRELCGSSCDHKDAAYGRVLAPLAVEGRAVIIVHSLGHALGAACIETSAWACREAHGSLVCHAGRKCRPVIVHPIRAQDDCVLADVGNVAVNSMRVVEEAEDACLNRRWRWTSSREVSLAVRH
jgi:hypothetical protein